MNNHQGGERTPVRYIQDIRMTVRDLPATPFSIFNCFHRKWNLFYKTLNILILYFDKVGVILGC